MAQSDIDEKNEIVVDMTSDTDGEEAIETISADDFYVDDPKALYSSVEVTDILNKHISGEKKLTPDMVRYWAKDFLDMLDIEKSSATDKGRWYFHASDIEKLKIIIPLKRDQGKTTREIKNILSDDVALGIYLNNDKFMSMLSAILEKNNQLIQEKIEVAFKAIADEHQSESHKLLETTEEREKMYEEKIERLQNQVSELQQLLEERLPEKQEKKGLFGIFRK